MSTKNADRFSPLFPGGQAQALLLKIVLCLVLVFALVIRGECGPEVYKYTDKDGIVHFTDDLSDVPVEQRTKVEAYQERKPPGVPEKDAMQKGTTDETSRKAAPLTSPGFSKQGKDPAVLEELKARKAALNRERSQLEKEQVRLAEQGEKVRATRAIWKLNSDLKELSERFAAHEEKRNAFEEAWDAYYSSIEVSPELEELKARKAALDTERAQLQQERVELAEKGRKVKNRREIRWHKHQLQELNERIATYRKKRDAFEEVWDAFYYSQ